MDPELKLEVLQELSKRLKGKCSKRPSTCPNEIIRDFYFKGLVVDFYYDYNWCSWCEENFEFLFAYDNNNSEFYPCPCYCTDRPGEVILHLEQIIEELEEGV
jgi:hypothetical protein